MRKEKYWSNSSSSSGRSSSSSSKKTEQQKKICRSSSNGGTTTTTAVNGCMSAMFQLFDFNNHSSSLRFTSSSVVVHQETKPPGIEAPRNSLEVDETTVSSSSNHMIEDSLSLEMGIQIKTKTDKRDSVCSEVSSSPGTRTPTLVARLMGLDLLPDSTSSSPRPSSTNGSTPNSLPSHSRTNRPKHLLRGRKSCSDMDTGTRSVPETTAKISLSRRSDVEHYHRPSINKENITDFDLSRLMRKQVKSGGDEGLSNARQIVKQVKETVSRRSAMSDVTNVVRRDQLVISNQLKREKLSRAAEVDGGSRHRYHREVSQKPVPPPQCANSTAEVEGDRFLSRRSGKTAADAVMRNRLQEESYVRPSSPAARGGNNGGVTDKRCKKTTPLLSGMRSIGGGGGVPTVLPIKKDPSPPATKIPVKQQQPHDNAPQSNNTSDHLSTTSSNSRHCHVVGTHNCHRLTAATTTTAKLAELHYVSSIFKCMNINLSPNVPLPSSFIFSPKNPIFDDFRTRISFLSATNGLVGLKCNQKLLLDLVEELIFDFFKPFRNFGVRVSPVRKYRMYGHVTLGLELVNEVKAKVESFPRAQCHVLEDIDAIVDVDQGETSAAATEEGGEMAAEIEGYIWNGLMQELAREI